MEIKNNNNKVGISTPKKYQKYISLIEKFEEMTCEERQAYLDQLEKEIIKIKSFSDGFDEKYSQDFLTFLKNNAETLFRAAEAGTAGALLGMSSNPNLGTAIGGALAFGSAYTLGEFFEDTIQSEIYAKKLDKIMEEWVACSMVENSPQCEL